MERLPQQPEEQTPRYGVANLTFDELSVLSAQLGAEVESAFATGIGPAPESPSLRAIDALYDEVRLLVQEDPNKAMVLFPKLVGSNNRHDRELAAVTIDEYYAIDPGSGSELWCALLADRDSLVSDIARSSIERGFGAPRYPTPEVVTMIQELADGYRHFVQLFRAGSAAQKPGE